MTSDERQELIAAVREALGPFKEELKTELKAEIQTELLEPMETRLRDDLRGEMGEMESRLRGEMGEMESRLRGEMGEMESRLRDDLHGEMGEMESRLGKRMDRLEAEIRSLTSDVVRPFIDTVYAQHKALVEWLERLERQVERNRESINQLLIKVDMQERRLLRISDDVAVIRQRLNSLELQLSGEITYDITRAGWVVAAERSVYEMIRDLEERVARLEARSNKGVEEAR